ncbi:MAG: GyrI-like domain-containing protein [Eggerthellaceae bacterium]
MAFDFKKEYKDLYLPKARPMLIDVPPMTFAAVPGKGDPNEEGGAYKQAVGLLYAFSFTIKMSKMGAWQPEGYFDYVVPPLEGLWWSDSGAFDGSALVDKSQLSWVSLIRQPDFVTPSAFEEACRMLAEKKPEFSDALGRGDLRLVRFAEGICAQVMHKGPYDDEPASIEKLSAFIEEQGCRSDITDAHALSCVGGGSTEGGMVQCDSLQCGDVLDALDVDGRVPCTRLHHEIYLGDPRRSKPENLKTVIRHPVKMTTE